MKKFIIEVPEGETSCKYCPLYLNKSVCQYLSENKICSQYDFTKFHIWDNKEELKEKEERK